jgi:hypothetical protein
MENEYPSNRVARCLLETSSRDDILPIPPVLMNKDPGGWIRVSENKSCRKLGE